MDRDVIQTFLGTITGYFAHATTVGLLAVADRSGLLAYLGDNPSGTSEEIAAGADLDERYVREIMSGLAAAGIVRYDANSKVFELPAEHALFLSDESSPYFMGGYFDMIPAMLSQVDGVARAVVHGGGVGFEEFGSDIVRGIDRGNTPSQNIFLLKRWLPAVDGLTDSLEAGIRVADVGCGSGSVAIKIAEAFPNSTVVGFDISDDSLANARSRGEHLDNLSFHNHGASEIPIDPGFDLITTFDVIHDLADPFEGLNRIHEALSPDGRYLMMEPNASSNLEDNLDDRGALLYGLSTMHCMTQSLAVGGTGLGSAWGAQLAEEMATEAGFGSFTHLEGISNKFSSFYLLTR